MRILLLGSRTGVALELLRRLGEAGHAVWVADAYAAQLCATSRFARGQALLPSPRFAPQAFADAVAELARAQGIERIVPTGEEGIVLARERQRLPPGCTLLADRYERLVQLHDKLAFNRLAAELGFAVPRSFPIRSAAELPALLEQLGELVLKPAYSRFGVRARIVTRPEPELAALFHGQELWLAQQRIPGRELCTFAIAQSGEVRALVVYVPTYRLPLGPAFYLTPIAHPKLAAWVTELVRRIGYTGMLGLDFIERADGSLWPLECNPRATTGVHLLSGRTLVQVIAGPDAIEQGSIGLAEPSPPRMLALAMLTAGARQITSLRGLWTLGRDFLRARDVFWDRGDPRPFFHQLGSLPLLVKLSRKTGLPLRRATTYYTEWNGEPSPPESQSSQESPEPPAARESADAVR